MTNIGNVSLVFAAKVGNGWHEVAGSDCKAYQQRFLCRQACGAYHTAKSYWILQENKCFIDCVALARNMLERIANSICAAKSQMQAVELITYELSEKIRHAKSWNPPTHLASEVQQMITEHEGILTMLLGLIQQTKAPAWKFFKRFHQAPPSRFDTAKLASSCKFCFLIYQCPGACSGDIYEPGIDDYYRSGYFDFSRYAHAGYEVSPRTHTKASDTADFIALAAPVITAGLYHRLDCPSCTAGKCDVHDQSVSLIKRFSSSTLSKNTGGPQVLGQ